MWDMDLKASVITECKKCSSSCCQVGCLAHQSNNPSDNKITGVHELLKSNLRAPSSSKQRWASDEVKLMNHWQKNQTSIEDGSRELLLQHRGLNSRTEWRRLRSKPSSFILNHWMLKSKPFGLVLNEELLPPHRAVKTKINHLVQIQQSGGRSPSSCNNISES